MTYIIVFTYPLIFCIGFIAGAALKYICVQNKIMDKEGLNEKASGTKDNIY